MYIYIYIYIWRERGREGYTQTTISTLCDGDHRGEDLSEGGGGRGWVGGKVGGWVGWGTLKKRECFPIFYFLKV